MVKISSVVTLTNVERLPETQLDFQNKAWEQTVNILRLLDGGLVRFRHKKYFMFKKRSDRVKLVGHFKK